MRKTLILGFLLILITGFSATAEVKTLNDCRSDSGMEPQFILDGEQDSHLLNFSETDYDSNNDHVVCMNKNFSVTTESSQGPSHYTEAFSVTDYFTNPSYGSHVRFPAIESGLTTYMKYEGLERIDDIGQGVCSLDDDNCKFLLSVNNTGTDHGSHVGKKDSGENLMVDLETGFRVNVRSIEQHEDNPYNVNVSVSADTGTDSIGIFERVVDWNTSDNIDNMQDADQGQFKRRPFTTSPRNVTENLISPDSYPNSGQYDVNMSLRYTLNDGRVKYKNRSLSLPSGKISWDRNLEIEDADSWIVMAPTEEVQPDQYGSCGSFLGYRGTDSGVSTVLNTAASKPLPAEPMLATVSSSCEIGYNHVTSPNEIGFGKRDSVNEGGWNVTRLQSKMNYTKFFEGDTNCGSVLSYGVTEENELDFELVTSPEDSAISESKLPKKALVSTTNDCTVTR